jgi:glutamate formiminotransferase / formiminotetrahydrofolate cyclodeaminase
MKQIIAFPTSASNNMDIINQITAAITSVDGIKLIDVDPGKATNRTVVTFVGPPIQVCEAAFRSVKKAAELIDMRKHKGEHPRFGATDVLPLVPVAGISMEETALLARQLGHRIGTELGIPVYGYEFAASEEKRRNLANCRAGEYEGLPNKLSDPDWVPDFGPAIYNNDVAKTGATAVSARNFLIAYNINLNTTSTRLANSIAFDIREKGRIKREGNTITGKPIKDENGHPLFEPGLLKGVKGIGWYIEEYGIAQLSFNITDITQTSLHELFEKACERANIRGIRVTGSELVGVVPKQVLIDAGKYFLHKQKRSAGIADDEILKIAIKSLGLNELTPFVPRKKIIEYLIDDNANLLIDKSVQQLANLTASELPAPGGGSIAATMGALGAALGTMVANLSAHKKGWDNHWEEFAQWAEMGKTYLDNLLKLVDEDTMAFNAIMHAYKLPKGTDSEKTFQQTELQKAVIYAIEVPLKVMQLSYQSMEVIYKMAEIGNPNSVSDAGVGALAARSAVLGAALNVRINAAACTNEPYVKNILSQVSELEKSATLKETEILLMVNSKINTRA